MATRFFSLLRARFFGSPSETAVEVGVNGEAHPRLSIDAGGRLNWGVGSTAVDVNLYRDAANVLKTDDTFKAPILFVDNIEIDTTGATSNQVLKFDGTKFVPGTASAVASLDDLSDVVITSAEKYQTIVYDGTNWINEFPTTVSLVQNAEATTLTAGTAVYIFGGTGNHASVKRADYTTDVTSSKTIGLVSGSIASGANGPVVTRGYVSGIDLSVGYSAGDVLWLGANGAFTKTKPSAPNHLVFIGIVARATSNGIIYVATQNGYELEELHDVKITSPQSGDFLKWNGTTWVNSSDGGASLTVSDTAPASPSTGDMWFESDTGATYVYYDSFWVEIGASSKRSTTIDVNDLSYTYADGGDANDDIRLVASFDGGNA